MFRSNQKSIFVTCLLTAGLYVACAAVAKPSPDTDPTAATSGESTDEAGSPLTEATNDAAAAAAAKTSPVKSDDAAIPPEDADAVAPSLSEKKRPWSPPNYSKQDSALGYEKDLFEIPEALKPRVQFWIDIYSKYTTDEGVLHDSRHVAAVYETVDFRPIMNDSSLTDRQKSKARRALVEDKKKAIKERLLKLSTVTSADGLTGDDLRYWQMFSNSDEPNKFKEASQKGRLRFQLGQKDRFLQGIYYSGRYLKPMEKIFADAGLPLELTRLPFVESSFNVKARSRVGASGIWQFMRYTGKKFLRISSVSDERNDPIKAAHAAARLMKLNFNMLQKWPLAVTGYNHGPTGVQRMVTKYKTSEISELVDERNGRFGFASANFYACFLAAVHTEKNAEKYFGKVYWDSPLEAAEVKPTRSISKKQLLAWFDGDVEKAKDLNPHLTRTFWQGYGSINDRDFFRVRQNKLAQVQAEMTKMPAVAEKSESPKGTETYVIGAGETLSGIASQFNVKVSKILDLNGIENPKSIRAGQKILLPRASQE